MSDGTFIMAVLLGCYYPALTSVVPHRNKNHIRHSVYPNTPKTIVAIYQILLCKLQNKIIQNCHELFILFI